MIGFAFCDDKSVRDAHACNRKIAIPRREISDQHAPKIKPAGAPLLRPASHPRRLGLTTRFVEPFVQGVTPMRDP
jgi:hypothetical protein